MEAEEFPAKTTSDRNGGCDRDKVESDKGSEWQKWRQQVAEMENTSCRNGSCMWQRQRQQVIEMKAAKWLKPRHEVADTEVVARKVESKRAALVLIRVKNPSK